MILGFVQNSFFENEKGSLSVKLPKLVESEWVVFHMNKPVFLKTIFELEKDLWV